METPSDHVEVVELAHPLAPGPEAVSMWFEGVTLGYDLERAPGAARPLVSYAVRRDGAPGWPSETGTVTCTTFHSHVD